MKAERGPMKEGRRALRQSGGLKGLKEGARAAKAEWGRGGRLRAKGGGPWH